MGIKRQLEPPTRYFTSFDKALDQLTSILLSLRHTQTVDFLCRLLISRSAKKCNNLWCSNKRRLWCRRTKLQGQEREREMCRLSIILSCCLVVFGVAHGRTAPPTNRPDFDDSLSVVDRLNLLDPEGN